MKNLNKFLAATLVMACLSSTSYAQTVSATDQTTASAIIVAPLAIDNTVPFNFGRLASNDGGDAVLSTAGTVTPGVGVKVMTGGAPTAASFTVSGDGANTFEITWPADPVVLTSPAQNAVDMTITTFTTAAAIGTFGTLSGGTQVFTAGATLTIGAGQVAGTYTSDPFEVIVSYN